MNIINCHFHFNVTFFLVSLILWLGRLSNHSQPVRSISHFSAPSSVHIMAIINQILPKFWAHLFYHVHHIKHITFKRCHTICCKALTSVVKLGRQESDTLWQIYLYIALFSVTIECFYPQVLPSPLATNKCPTPMHLFLSSAIFSDANNYIICLCIHQIINL